MNCSHFICAIILTLCLFVHGSSSSFCFWDLFILVSSRCSYFCSLIVWFGMFLEQYFSAFILFRFCCHHSLHLAYFCSVWLIWFPAYYFLFLCFRRQADYVLPSAAYYISWLFLFCFVFWSTRWFLLVCWAFYGLGLGYFEAVSTLFILLGICTAFLLFNYAFSYQKDNL